MIWWFVWWFVWFVWVRVTYTSIIQITVSSSAHTQLPREMCARTCCVLRVGILPPAWRVCTHTRSLFCLSLSLPPLLPPLPSPLRRPSLTKIQRMTILQMPRSASHREASHVTARPKTLTTVWMKIHYPGNRHVAIDGGRETYMAAWDDSACHSFLRVRPAEVRGQRGGGSSICLSCMPVGM